MFFGGRRGRESFIFNQKWKKERILDIPSIRFTRSILCVANSANLVELNEPHIFGNILFYIQFIKFKYITGYFSHVIIAFFRIANLENKLICNSVFMRNVCTSNPFSLSIIKFKQHAEIVPKKINDSQHAYLVSQLQLLESHVRFINWFFSLSPTVCVRKILYNTILRLLMKLSRWFCNALARYYSYWN